MELSFSLIKNHHFSSSFSMPKVKKNSALSPSTKTQQIPAGGRHSGGVLGGGLVVECAKGGGPAAEEVNWEEEWVAGRWREKCKGGRGIVELMECLEREAIMGEDEGREATDYNRRAHIFDKSSTVFKALKETNDKQQH